MDVLSSSRISQYIMLYFTCSVNYNINNSRQRNSQIKEFLDLSIILYSKITHHFGNWISFPSLGGRMGRHLYSGFIRKSQSHTLAQWLRLALSNRPKYTGASPSFCLRNETDPISKMVWSFWIWDDGKVQKLNPQCNTPLPQPFRNDQGSILLFPTSHIQL
jgi:hypothetical protein